VRGDSELHKAKNVLEKIWPDRVSAALAALPFCNPAFSQTAPIRCNWLLKTAWKRLNDEVGGHLIPVEFAQRCKEWSADGFTKH
jgi:hypothetical protein